MCFPKISLEVDQSQQ